MKLLITGPQGSGKTTQAKIISEKLNLCLVKLGELLRQRAQINDEEGQSLKEDLERGALVKNEIAARLLKEELDKPKCYQGYIVDGYPRSLSQLEVYDPNYDQVICIDLSEDEAIQRLRERGRSDDTPQVVKKRFDWFRDETQKTIKHYEDLGILAHINGDQSIDKVSEEILANLKI